MNENLWSDERPHHCFEVIDSHSGLKQSNHLQIHCFELDKVRFLHEEDSSPRAAWLHFFAEGECWATVPDRFRRPSVEASMSILERYRDNRHDFEVYRAREERLRVQATIERSNREFEEQLAKERAEKEQANAKVERANTEIARANAEIERVNAEKERERAEKELLQAKLKELRARFGDAAGG